MRDEILKYRGMAAELERKIAELEVIVSADVAAARNLLNPFEDDVTRLKSEQILAIAVRIHEKVTQIRDYQKKLADIREMLA